MVIMIIMISLLSLPFYSLFAAVLFPAVVAAKRNHKIGSLKLSFPAPHLMSTKTKMAEKRRGDGRKRGKTKWSIVTINRLVISPSVSLELDGERE